MWPQPRAVYAALNRKDFFIQCKSVVVVDKTPTYASFYLCVFSPFGEAANPLFYPDAHVPQHPLCLPGDGICYRDQQEQRVIVKVEHLPRIS